MRYVSTLLLILAMYWSWGLARNDQAISQQVHVGIQDELKKLIADYIQQNLPNSTNLRFERFWTESLTENQVKASFIYSFEDTSEQTGATRVQIEGDAILNRVLADAKNKEVADNKEDSGNKDESPDIEWSLDKIEILNNQIDYQNPMNVSPNDKTATAPAVENNSEKEKSEQTHE